jgi:hypothetical protein
MRNRTFAIFAITIFPTGIFFCATPLKAEILELTCLTELRVKDMMRDSISASTVTVYIATSRESAFAIEPNLVNAERNLGKKVTSLIVLRNAILGKMLFVEGRTKDDVSDQTCTLSISRQLYSGTISTRIGSKDILLSSYRSELTISRNSGRIFLSKVETVYDPVFSETSVHAEGTCELKAATKPRF